MNAILQLFMKAPVPGQVKTRLCPPLSYEQAAHIHEQLCLQLCDALASIPSVVTEIWVGRADDGDEEVHNASAWHPFFTTLQTRYGLSLYRQCKGNLGVRMHDALQNGLNRAERVVIVGGDCLSVDAAYVGEALNALDSPASVVLGPADDGGYVLVGARQCRPGMFENVMWGSEQAFLQTLNNFARLNYGVKLLMPRWDIDTYQDLQRRAPALLNAVLANQ